MSLKEQFLDWKYLISKDNATSRGFYLFMTIALVFVMIVAIAFCVVAALGFVTGVLRIIGFIAPVIAIGITLGLVWLLSRN